MAVRALRLSLCIALGVLVVAVVQRSLAATEGQPGIDDGPSLASTLERDLEPVVVVGAFPGVPVDHLFVYRQNGDTVAQIPFQIDEVTATGAYTESEDGVMDSGDEIVFMAGDLGEKSTTISTATLPISSTWYEIEATDPLSSAHKGWAYVVRSDALTRTNAIDYARYVAASQRVSSTNYAIGWATSHAGLSYQTLFGSENILDRTKLRVKYTFIVHFSLTEDSSLFQPPSPVTLVKDGPVRVIVRRGAATTFAYASFIRTLTVIDLSAVPGTLDEIRVSTDLGEGVTGTYYNENTPGGVTVDGVPESLLTTLSESWRQTSLDGGTVIQVVNLNSVGGTPFHYYKDNSAFDPDDTGDGRSNGDAGIRVVRPAYKSFSLESVQYILPGKQANRGQEFWADFGAPLIVTTRLCPDTRQRIYLPLVLRAHEQQ